MKITVERNSGADSGTIPYYARIEIVTVTVDAGSVFHVPVYAAYVGQQKMYNLEICGFRVETGNPQDIPFVAERLLAGLINMARLPSYVFISRRAGGIYPVYTVDSEVFATTPGGPVFRQVELAKVREYLGDYLHEVGILGEKGLSDKLHVRGVNMKTLGLRRPVFYLKKRVPGQVDFWAPVFESGDGTHIYTYAADARREAPIKAGGEVLALRSLVAGVLLADNRLKDLYDLRPDRLFPAYWQRLQTALEPAGTIAVNGIEMPLYSNASLYSNGLVWIGLETRHDENRYSLFVGKDAEDVRYHAAQDFQRRNLKRVYQPVAAGV